MLRWPQAIGAVALVFALMAASVVGIWVTLTQTAHRKPVGEGSGILVGAKERSPARWYVELDQGETLALPVPDGQTYEAGARICVSLAENMFGDLTARWTNAGPCRTE